MRDWPINQPSDAVRLKAPVDILCSFHYFKSTDMEQIASWGTRIIGDSGAFSAMSLGQPVEREEFHAWAHRWEDALFWTASLDVIGDPEETYLNWKAARRDGLELVPTVHYGEGTEVLDRFAEEGATLIGLGGMVPYSSEKERLMRWCLKMHRHARDHHPHVRFHGWGISHPYLMDNLPWWSADSSGFSSAFRFGSLRLWAPHRGRFVSVDLNGRDLAKHAKFLRDVYGEDWRRVSVSLPENRRELGRVALKGLQLYGDWLQKRQRVSPPQLLIDRMQRRSIGPISTLEDGSAAEEVGPIQIAAHGTGGDAFYLHPEGGYWPSVGPTPVGAMGAPEMQPIKALHPDSKGPDKVSQPAPVAAIVHNESIDALSPDLDSPRESLRRVPVPGRKEGRADD